MLRESSQNWRSCKNSVYSCKVVHTYVVTNSLFVKIFLSVPCTHDNPMKLNLAICSVLSLSSWWQQHLGKTCGLQCQNGVTVCDSFVIRKNRSRRQHSLLVLRLRLVIQMHIVTEWQGRNREWSKIRYNRTLHEKLRQNRLYYTKVAVGN